MQWSIEAFNKKLEHMAFEQKTRVHDKFAEIGAEANAFSEAMEAMSGTEKTEEEKCADMERKLKEFEANA